MADVDQPRDDYPRQYARAVRYGRLLERHEWVPFIDHHLARRKSGRPFPTDHVPPLADMMLEAGDPRGLILQRSLEPPPEKDRLVSVYDGGDMANFRHALPDGSTVWGFPLAPFDDRDAPTHVSLVWSGKGDRLGLPAAHVGYFGPDEARDVLRQFGGEMAEKGHALIDRHFGGDRGR